MKKIIALLVISLFLTSCGNKDEETTPTDINTPTTIETNDGDIKIEIKENDSDIKVEVKEDNSDETIKVDIDGDDVIIDTPDTKEETKTEATSDEEALESEVNDLLDEFIDSLDSYDK